MKAIILVAGYATRLYPLTLNMPKALLPIKKKPIIDYIVDELNTIPAVSEIFVVSNHKFAGHFETWAKNATSNTPIKVIDDGTTTEDNRRGAIGDIQFVIEQENIDEEIMVIAGDNFFTYSLIDYYNYYTEIDKDCVIVKENDNIEELKSFGVAQVDENGKVVSLEEKPAEPKSNLAVYATYIYKKETIPLFEKYLNAGNKPDAPGYFVSWLYTQKDVYVYRMQGECYDIGTPQSYEDIQKLFPYTPSLLEMLDDMLF